MSALGTCKRCKGDLCTKGTRVCCIQCGLPVYADGEEEKMRKEAQATRNPPPETWAANQGRKPANPAAVTAHPMVQAAIGIPAQSTISVAQTDRQPVKPKR